MGAVRPQIILFGDSITEQSFRPGGWGAALADNYSRKADILNRGYGGYTTRWALFLLHHIFPLGLAKPPVAVTIFFGANDAALPGRNSDRQHVPIEEYRENLRKIIEHLKKCSPTMLVVLITSPPVDEEGRMEYARSLYGDKAMTEPERTNETAGIYAKQCVTLAEELGVCFINLWSKMQETEGWQRKYLRDQTNKCACFGPISSSRPRRKTRLLIQLVERFGVRKWSHIAQLLNGRIGKQGRERWHNHLKPNIKKDVWSEDEDRILIKAHQEMGNKWAEIAKRLPGRTENSIKNHWNATKRRQFSKRKCRSKYPRQRSLLQEYIKSLDPEVINAGCRKKPSSSPTHALSNRNHSKSSSNQSGSSGSSSSDRLGHEYDFSEVPNFNFDAQMLEESSMDSFLDGTPNKDNEIAIGAYDHRQGKGSYESLDDPQIEFAPMVQYGVKKELDLVEMINQVNI